MIALIVLVLLHGPDQQPIAVNPDQVVSIRQPRETEQQHFQKGIRCLVVTSDGKFVAVVEPCDEVRVRLGHNQ